MPRKANLEDTVLSYFTTAPLPAAELMLRIASGAVKRRQSPAVIPALKAKKQAEQNSRAPIPSVQGRTLPSTTPHLGG